VEGCPLKINANGATVHVASVRQSGHHSHVVCGPGKFLENTSSTCELCEAGKYNGVTVVIYAGLAWTGHEYITIGDMWVMNNYTFDSVLEWQQVSFLITY
jgi:hypothetical protein